MRDNVLTPFAGKNARELAGKTQRNRGSKRLVIPGK
jgi:hypothetical protein